MIDPVTSRSTLISISDLRLGKGRRFNVGASEGRFFVNFLASPSSADRVVVPERLTVLLRLPSEGLLGAAV